MTHFLLYSGEAGHGKDASATITKEFLESKGYSVLITHYADLLKFICTNFFGWNGEKDEAGRTLLQYIGTDCVREQDPNYWVDFIANFIKMFPERYDFVIIPDARFPNEITRICEAGFPVTHARIIRLGFNNLLTDEQKQHLSENALKCVEPDYVIHNTTLPVLKEQLEALCDIIIAQKKRAEVM